MNFTDRYARAVARVLRFHASMMAFDNLPGATAEERKAARLETCDGTLNKLFALRYLFDDGEPSHAALCDLIVSVREAHNAIDSGAL